MGTSVFVRALSVLSFLLALASPLAAQAMAPPPYLQIFQEQIKVGRAGTHPAAEAGWPRAFAKAKIQNHYIAMTTIYGPLEAWFTAGAPARRRAAAVDRAVQ